MIPASSSAVRLTIGLPVYNGEHYLADALDSLLAQDFGDFVIIISDNASTDSTESVAREYATRDARVSYVRHPTNQGAAFNHNYVLDATDTPYFKWASDDDRYDPTFLSQCIRLLDEQPEAVLAHCSTTYIDDQGDVVDRFEYNLKTDHPNTAVRYWSTLYHQGGDDFYGVFRTEVLKESARCATFHYAERVLMAEVVLRGPFAHASGGLYYRRDHPTRAERTSESIRERAANYGPDQAVGGAISTAFMLGGYVLGFVKGIRRVPMPAAEKMACSAVLGVWLLTHLNPLRRRRLANSPDPAIRDRALGRRSR